jgi:hypothetical protein
LLSAEIRRFILTSIPSVPYLEALLLLHSESGTLWTSSALAKRLYISDKQSHQLLEQLCDAHIAKAKDDAQHFSYSPASDDLRGLIGQLSILYSKDLLEITHLIHSKTDRKAQQFADAFKLRKDT